MGTGVLAGLETPYSLPPTPTPELLEQTAGNQVRGFQGSVHVLLVPSHPPPILLTNRYCIIFKRGPGILLSFYPFDALIHRVLTEFPFCARHWGDSGGEVDPLLLLYQVRRRGPSSRSTVVVGTVGGARKQVRGAVPSRGVRGPVSAEGTSS